MMPTLVPITPPWKLDVKAGPVEQHVAQSPAQDYAQRGVEDEVVGVPPRHRGTRLADQLQEVPIAKEDAGEVRQAVPAQLEHTKVQRHRVEPQAGKVDPGGCYIVHSVFPRRPCVS
jgi:hypothetical protein